jgi:hypothetical protein
MKSSHKKFLIHALVIALLLLAGNIVYGGWFQSSTNPPDPNVTEPLSIGAGGQNKSGGLKLNAGGALHGLTIPHDPNNPTTTGRVYIGINNPPQNQSEKLFVEGNISLTGVIKPNGTAPKPDQILAVDPATPTQMAWTEELSWMTIPRIDILKGGVCVSVYPSCPPGWTQHENIVFSTNCVGWSYGNEVRICYK